MSDEKLPPLDDDLRALLDRTARTDVRVPDSAKGRVWERLANPTPPVALSPPASTSSAPRSSLARLALGTAIYVAGVVSGALLFRGESVPIAPSSPPSVPVAEVIAPVSIPTLPVDAGVVDDAAMLGRSVDPEPAPRAPGSNNVSLERETEAQHERLLVERARSALARGDANEALEVLGRHRTQHSRGQLREERDALNVQALINAGRIDDARAEALRFKRTFPESLFTAIVDRAVRSRASNDAGTQ